MEAGTMKAPKQLEPSEQLANEMSERAEHAAREAAALEAQARQLRIVEVACRAAFEQTQQMLQQPMPPGQEFPGQPIQG